ncbi:hypothetical protein Q3A68_17720 [Mucilaginibacter sp. BT774]|nr:hypothetical protein [Mucilaginibacter sp. BT774]
MRTIFIFNDGFRGVENAGCSPSLLLRRLKLACRFQMPVMPFPL